MSELRIEDDDAGEGWRIGRVRVWISDRCAHFPLAVWRGTEVPHGSKTGRSYAVAARSLGLCDACITVHMSGGQLQIIIADDYAITMIGPVTKVCDGVISDEALAAGSLG